MICGSMQCKVEAHCRSAECASTCLASILCQPADCLLSRLPHQSNAVHAGLSDSQADEVETSLMAMPTVHMAANCVVDGEESSDIMESDIVTCTARVVLTRHSHLSPGMLPSWSADLYRTVSTQLSRVQLQIVPDIWSTRMLLACVHV